MEFDQGAKSHSKLFQTFPIIKPVDDFNINQQIFADFMVLKSQMATIRPPVNALVNYLFLKQIIRKEFT